MGALPEVVFSWDWDTDTHAEGTRALQRHGYGDIIKVGKTIAPPLFLVLAMLPASGVISLRSGALLVGATFGAILVAIALLWLNGVREERQLRSQRDAGRGNTTATLTASAVRIVAGGTQTDIRWDQVTRVVLDGGFLIFVGERRTGCYLPMRATGASPADIRALVPAHIWHGV